ncbi:hypothetical protein [Pseudomonas sp. 24 R 17]|uniref:hypothetical protein n=1 Tax=Pseudomonas sp. 24 R 17 TaxID=1844096 RepID=UPI0009F1BD02|nr:hypothetical protein [Pseudomonas sp. 24 R 17]
MKSALLRKICQRLVNQQTGNLRRAAIFVPVLTVKPALKRFYTASANSGHSSSNQRKELLHYADRQLIHMLPSIDFAEQKHFRKGTDAARVIDYFAEKFHKL